MRLRRHFQNFSRSESTQINRKKGKTKQDIRKEIQSALGGSLRRPRFSADHAVLGACPHASISEFAGFLKTFAHNFANKRVNKKSQTFACYWNLIFWPYFIPYYFKYLLIPCFTLKFNMSAKIESQEVAGARASCEARVPAAHRSHLAAAGPLPRDEGARQRRREQGPADERLVHHL